MLGVDKEVERLIESKKISLRLQAEASERYISTIQTLQGLWVEEERDVVRLRVESENPNAWNSLIEGLIAVQKVGKLYQRFNEKGEQLHKNLAKIKSQHLLKFHPEGFSLANTKVKLEIDVADLKKRMQYLRDQLGEDLIG